MTQEALPALSNQNDEGTAGLRSRTCADPARDEKGPEIFILSLAQDTRAEEPAAIERNLLEDVGISGGYLCRPEKCQVLSRGHEEG
jgi:hypothetical protein